MKTKYFFNILIIISCSFPSHVNSTSPNSNMNLQEQIEKMSEEEAQKLLKKNIISIAALTYIRLRWAINPRLINKIIDKQRYPYHHYAATTGANLLSYVLVYKLLDRNISTSKISYNAALDTASIVAGDGVDKAITRVTEKLSPGINNIGFGTMLHGLQIKKLLVSGASEVINLTAQHQIEQWLSQYKKYPYDA